jgi:Cu2+-containing amine oxidase
MRRVGSDKAAQSRDFFWQYCFADRVGYPSPPPIYKTEPSLFVFLEFISFFTQTIPSHPTTTTMSTEQIPISLPFVGSKKVVAQHPIGPLTASEISQSASLIKSVWPSGTNIQFKVITLQEPKKSELAPFLAAERAGASATSVDRRCFVAYYIRNTVSILPVEVIDFRPFLLMFSGQTS